MADKTSTGTEGSAIAASSVTTAGTIAAGVVSIIFDDATAQDVVMANLEKAKAQIAAYYLKR